ncbi:MAG: hypothetical protein EAZ07_06320 [Cytophagales bacterium]|nr:MAG: hypothetical protein EAZ07_06320 [Cytophagales bacterium]
MKQHIQFPSVEGVYIAIVKENENLEKPVWRVYLINTNNFELSSVAIRSKGYGFASEGVSQETTVLRYFIQSVAAQHYEAIELIDHSVFHLYNEYWVSYFIGDQIYDKKFVFVPDSIVEQNLTKLPILEQLGILHN